MNLELWQGEPAQTNTDHSIRDNQGPVEAFGVPLWTTLAHQALLLLVGYPCLGSQSLYEDWNVFA